MTASKYSPERKQKEGEKGKKTVDAVKDEKSMIGECGNTVPANRVPRRAG
jgi:hypothetical protein